MATDSSEEQIDHARESARGIRWLTVLIWLGFLAFLAYSFQAIMDLDGIGDPRRQRVFLRVLTALSTPDFSDAEASRQVAMALWETVQIALLATTIGSCLAIPFALFSARPSSLWGRTASLLLQPILSVVRAVHPLIVTIPAAIFVGIGPTAGVLALTLFSTATLIVIFSEYAQTHTSLDWPILFKARFPALALKHFHVNILIATVLGLMGGGGIGFLLQMNLNLLNYRDASTAILACVLTIGGFDLLGRAIWNRIQKS
jgi:phosphonate transport system permease protein